MRCNTAVKCFPLRFLMLLPIVLSLSVASTQARSKPEGDAVNVTDTVIAVDPVAPVTSLIASDYKYDNGEQIELSWVPSIDDQLLNGKVIAYHLYRQTDGRPGELIAELEPGSNYFLDTDLDLDASYSYRVMALARDSETSSRLTASLSPQREWINFDKKWLLMIALFVGGAVVFFIETARRGKKLFIRKIAGLEAVDEAVGRATEMGRPILFIPGIQDLDDVQTLAGLTILGRISRMVADYDTQIHVPVSRSLVMTAARETIKASYAAAGRPDKYSDDMVNYITDEQFGYVASVDGLMVREKPATVFLLGAFFAESLILAETGNSIGAIQIAGTARPAQLPFFIAACDFTLIGEELFAASAYLSDDPKALGSLKGQDMGKALAMAIILIGVIAATIGEAWDVEPLRNLVSILSEVFSTN